MSGILRIAGHHQKNLYSLNSVPAGDRSRISQQVLLRWVKENGQCGAQMDILDSQAEQGQQYYDGFCSYHAMLYSMGRSFTLSGQTLFQCRAITTSE